MIAVHLEGIGDGPVQPNPYDSSQVLPPDLVDALNCRLVVHQWPVIQPGQEDYHLTFHVLSEVLWGLMDYMVPDNLLIKIYFAVEHHGLGVVATGTIGPARH